MLKKLENKYDTLKRAELCDANRITIQSAISLVLLCHRYNNRQLISDLLSAKIDNKAARILILSDTYMQLLFAKKYEGVNTPFYEDTRYKLMNYRRNEEGQICPDANVILFHRIKYEEEEWALWHELHSFANEFKISPLEAMFKKTPNINAFLLADHGVVAMGKDPLAAEHTAELVEETAQVAILDKVVEKLGL